MRLLRTSVFLLLLTLGQCTSAEINLSIDNIESTVGIIETAIHVSGGVSVTSINVAFGTVQLNEGPESSIMVTAFDPTFDPSSIWSQNVSSTAAPAIPAPATVFNIAQPMSTTADGTVLTVRLDASNTRPGDVFQMDLDFRGFSSASNGIEILDETLTFSGGLISITGIHGDFNANGVLDAADIDLLTDAVKAGENPSSFDLTLDGVVDGDDRSVWVEDVIRTYYGDSNLDGEFNSQDFIAVFRVGQYEDSIDGNSTWQSGDWNGDCEFDSSDFIVAFQSGGYERGPRSPIVNVPEPSTTKLFLFGTFIALIFLRTVVT